MDKGLGVNSHAASFANSGLASETVRHKMVQRLAKTITNTAVLDAMRVVPRHLFVEPALASQAYEDTALPIGFEQTISKPSSVARMVELLLNGQSRFSGKVLEIGAGCGYQAAVLGQLARYTWSIERIEGLAAKALTNIAALNLQTHVRVRCGDGMLGFKDVAPYCAIISAAGGEEVPKAWLEQLAIGGRLVAPCVVKTASGKPAQALRVLDKTQAGWLEQTLDLVHFVPLKSGIQVM